MTHVTGHDGGFCHTYREFMTLLLLEIYRRFFESFKHEFLEHAELVPEAVTDGHACRSAYRAIDTQHNLKLRLTYIAHKDIRTLIKLISLMGLVPLVAGNHIEFIIRQTRNIKTQQFETYSTRLLDSLYMYGKLIIIFLQEEFERDITIDQTQPVKSLGIPALLIYDPDDVIQQLQETKVYRTAVRHHVISSAVSGQYTEEVPWHERYGLMDGRKFFVLLQQFGLIRYSRDTAQIGRFCL